MGSGVFEYFGVVEAGAWLPGPKAQPVTGTLFFRLVDDASQLSLSELLASHSSE